MKVLMIGNSFSICVGKNLPFMVNLAEGLELELTSAYIGGCSLSRHWENIESAELDAAFKPYDGDAWDSSTPEQAVRNAVNVNELLQNNCYDVVTIQQASHESSFYEKYQPFADNLIAYIQKFQPQAEIVIQETWAYRADDRRFKREGDDIFGFGQDGMHNRLREAYLTLAKKHKFRIIPTGDAVKNARELYPIKYTAPSEEELASYAYPDLPKQAGDIVGNTRWHKDEESQELALRTDSIHLNLRGEYLQSCVWFAMLFGRPTTEIKYDHPLLGASYCKFLRECAQKAIDEFKQVNK